MTITAAETDATGWVPGDSWGVRLAQVRQVMGWNQAEAARACGVAQASWANWENGKNPRDPMSVASQISDATGVDGLWLLGVRRQGLEPRTRWERFSTLDRIDA